MKRSFLFALFVTIAGSAWAQEQPSAPVVEVGLDYSLVHATSASDGNQLTSNGGSGYFVYNLNRVLGLVADFGAYHNGSVHGSFDSDTTFTYLFGPRFNWRRWSRVTPYTQFLFGGARTSAGFIDGGGAGLASHENNFALAAGAGIDIALTHHIAIKPIQLEYLMTQTQDFAGSRANVQNGLRYSAGVVFRFGEKAR
jgi:opacity protein-like surface antigen